jgi:hypothetical protein
MRLGLPWEVLRQRTTGRFRFSRGLGRFGRRILDPVRRLLSGLCLLQIFEPQFQLFDLLLEFLALGPELHPPKLVQQQLQMFDLILPLQQLLLPLQQLLMRG